MIEDKSVSFIQYSSVNPLPTSNPPALSSTIPLQVQCRKIFKNFNKKKTIDKMSSFSKWVEIIKPIQDKTIYNQVKDYQFYEDTAFVLPQELEVNCLALCALTQTFAAGLINGVILLYNSKSGDQIVKTQGDPIKVNKLIFSDEFLFSGGDDTIVHKWSYTKKTISKLDDFMGHTGMIRALALSIDQTILISGDARGEIFLWNLGDKNKTSRRFMNTEAEYNLSVNGLLVSPDGIWIMAVGDEKTLKFWNLKDLTLEDTNFVHDETILAIAMSPKMDKFATGGSDKIINIYDLKQLKLTLEGHEDDVNCLEFLPNGKFLASGSEDKTIKIWNTIKGTLKATIEGHSGSIKCLAVHSKTALIISGSFDKTVRAWIFNQCKDVLTGSKNDVSAIISIPKTSYVLSGGKEKYIRVWSIEKAIQLKLIETNMQSISVLATNPEGSHFASGGSDGIITLYSIDSENCEFAVIGSSATHLNRVTALRFTIQGEFLVSGSEDQCIKIWDYTLKKELRELKKHPSAITAMNIIFKKRSTDPSLSPSKRSVELSPDHRIITGSKSSMLYVWDFENLKNPLLTLSGHKKEITTIALTNDSIISGSEDCTIKIWNSETGQLLNTLDRHYEGVTCLEITGDKERMVSVGKDQTLRIWDLQSGREIGVAKNFVSAITTMAIEAISNRVITNGVIDNGLRVVNINNIKTIKILSDRNRKEKKDQAVLESFNAVALSPDEKFLITGDGGNLIKIRDFITYKVTGELKGHFDRVRKVKFTKDMNKIVSCSNDFTARIWDLEHAESFDKIQSKTLKNFGGKIIDFEFFDQEKKAVFACANRRVVFYNLDTGDFIKKLQNHTAIVRSLAVNQEKQILYSSGDDKQILTYDLKNIEFTGILTEMESPVNALLLTKHNERLVIGCVDGSINIYGLFKENKYKFFEVNKENRFIITLKAHKKPVKCLTMNSKGTKLFSGGEDEAIQIWDLQDYKRLGVFDSSSQSVNSILVYARDKGLVTASTDQIIRIWDIDDSNQVPFCEGHFAKINRIETTKDGKYAFSCCYDKSVIMWDVKEGIQKNKLKGFKSPVKSLTITSNNKLITCCYDGNVKVWDITELKALSSFDVESEITHVITTNDDKEFILACYDSLIRVYDLETSKFKRDFKEGHNAAVQRLLLTPDNMKLISSGRDRLITIWDYKTTQLLQIIEGHEGPVYALAFIIEEKTLKLLSGGGDNTLRIWNLETKGNEKTIIGFEGAIKDIITTKDNKSIFIGVFAKKGVYRIDFKDIIEKQGEINLNEFDPYQFHEVDYEVNDILLTPDEKFLFAVGNPAIQIFDLTADSCLDKSMKGFSADIKRDLLSPNHEMIVLATADNQITVWDFKKKEIAKKDYHTKEITALLMTSDSKTIISAGKDKYVYFYNIKTLDFAKYRPHSGSINALAIDKSEKIIISASDDGTVKLLNFPKDSETKKIDFKSFSTGEDNVLGIVCFTSNESTIKGLEFLTGGTEKKVNLWNSNNEIPKTLAILPETIVGLYLSPDNHILIIYLANSMMQIWGTYDYSFINQLEMKENDFSSYPVFLSDYNNRIMLYFDKLIDCYSGQIIFKFEINREIINFYFNPLNNSYYYITPDFELYKLQDYWLQTYLFNYLKYDSITVFNKEPEILVKRQMSTYPFFFSFMHLITIFEKIDYFTEELMDEIYEGKVGLWNFFQLDIFFNTPLDIMILKKNTTLMNKYFTLFFTFFNKENCSFFEKISFINYSFRNDYDMLDLMPEIINLCKPDLSIISKIFDSSFLPLDPSIYDNSLVFKELELPLFITTDSLYNTGKSFFAAKLKEIFLKFERQEKADLRNLINFNEKVEQNQSMIKAKAICIPWICDFSNQNAEKIFKMFSDMTPDNSIFDNKVLQLLSEHIWATQIKFYFLWDFLVFLLFFVLYNVNFIIIYPLRKNIYYNDPETLAMLNLMAVIVDVLLLIYAIYSFINEMRQVCNTKGSYLKSIWNYFDILLIPLLVMASICDIHQTYYEASEDILIIIKVISSTCIFCFWFRFLSFFRAINETSSMMRLIFNVITSTRYFLLFMVIFMLSLSCAFYLLHTDNKDENPSFWDTFLVIYHTTVGDTSGITDYDLEISSFKDIFCIVSTFTFAIILLNLLVSIIGDIHSEINEAGARTRLYELINIIVDTNLSLTTYIVRGFKRLEFIPGKYLIQLYNEKHEEKEVNNYEELEKIMEENNKGIASENNVRFEKIEAKIEKINGTVERLNGNIEKLVDFRWEKLKEAFVEVAKK